MAYLLTELAPKIPEDILYYKVQMYLSSPTAEIIKEVFKAHKEDYVVYSLRGRKYKDFHPYIYYYKRNQEKLSIASYRYGLNENPKYKDKIDILKKKMNKPRFNKIKDIKTRVLISRRGYRFIESPLREPWYPDAPGFLRNTTPYIEKRKPDMYWKRSELYQLAQGLGYEVKMWSKKKLLQVLYPNLLSPERNE